MSRSSRDLRLNVQPRISRRVSSRNPSFSVKVGPVARVGSLVYHRGLRADGESSRTGRFDGAIHRWTRGTSSPPRDSVTEKNVAYSSLTVINVRRRADMPDAGTRADVSISWLTNARVPLRARRPPLALVSRPTN